MPNPLVTEKNDCVTIKPVAFVSIPYAIQNAFEIKNNAKPHPEFLLFNANKKAPAIPVKHPNHCVMSNSMRSTIKLK